MTKVVLQFSTQNDFISWAIRFFTWSDISHVDLVLPDGSLVGARSDGGVERRQPGYAPFSKTERYCVELPDVAAEIVFKTALEQVGKPYDYEGILGIFFRRDWRETDSWFCSELIAYAFEQSSNPLLRTYHVNRITPRDLTTSILLNKIS